MCGSCFVAIASTLDGGIQRRARDRYAARVEGTPSSIRGASRCLQRILCAETPLADRCVSIVIDQHFGRDRLRGSYRSDAHRRTTPAPAKLPKEGEVALTAPYRISRSRAKVPPV